MEFTKAQARFAAYYVMAWGTEASKVKSPYVFSPAFTRTISVNGGIRTTYGGASIGVLQIDLAESGRLDEARDLLAAYENWSRANGKVAIALVDLTSRGVDALTEQKGPALNEFLSTTAGKAIVDRWTAKEANYLITTAPSARISDTTYFSVLTEDQQLAVASATYKATNARGLIPGVNLVKFMNGDTVNGIKIDLTDSAAEIVEKFKQVVQTNIGETSGPNAGRYGSTASNAVLASFDKATKLSDVFNSAEFADARAYLDNPANSLSGAGASAQVQTQLSVLRVAAMHTAEVSQSGQPIGYEGRLFTDPATGNRVVYSNGAAMVVLPNQQGGWLMQGGQMIRYQDGEVLLRLQPNPTTGLLQVSAVLPGKNGAPDTVVALGPEGGYTVNPGFNAQNATPTYMADGTLALVSGQGSAKVLALLDGPYGGSTVAYLDRKTGGSGGALSAVSFSSDDNDPSNNYYAVIDDGKGGVVTRDVRPITANTDAGPVTLGSESTVVKKQNSITLSNTKTSTQTDLATGQLVANSDVSQFTPTGEFVSRAVNTVTTSSTGLQLADVKVTFNATGGVTQTSVTELQANGATKTVVRDGQGLIQSTTTRQISDDNSILETTTLPNGQVVQKSLDTEGQLAGTITDTPDGNGGFNRHISTVVDGKTLDVAQHIDASKAAVDKDGDGNFIDAGDATTTGVLIDGLCSALKDIAIKSIRTRPRGQFSPKSHAVYASTHHRRSHQPRPRSLAAQGAGVFAGQRLPGTQS